MSKCTRVSFFLLWAVFIAVGAILLCLNVKWHWLDTGGIIGAAFVMFVLIILHIGVMESLTVSIFTFLFCGDAKMDKTGDCSSLTMILNYNVLALDPGDIDEGMERMYASFMGNINSNVSAVYLSATHDPELKRYELLVRDRYRAKIRSVLQEECLAFINRDYGNVDYFRQTNMWRKLEDSHSLAYVKSNYEDICEKLAKEFMCIHRVSRVLRKCGQYQDLMLLSEGRFMAFTYTDPDYYGKLSRPYGEPMFHDSDDVRNIYKRKFDYTFVLDGDTCVPTGVANTVLGVAAGYPDTGIIQPAIKLEADIWDTIFMNLEDLRQRLGEPTTNALARVFDQCGYYGKALIKNQIYIKEIIGTPADPIEAVPIDVLSHDTYEAGILRPRFTRNAAIVEKPTYNYLSWNSRQRRWNLGDLIIAMYMYPRLVGAPIRALQRCVQGKKYFRPRVRTPLKMDTVTAYIANSSLRSMFTKPLWLILVLMHGFLPVPTYYHWLPVVVVLVIICVISKLSLFMSCHKGILYLIPELLSSICQYTPEIIAGFIRIIRVFIALVRGKNDWIPQRRVEKEFDTVNPFKMLVYSYRHLWGYALLALALMIMLILFDVTWGIYPLNSSLKMILIYFDLTVVFCLPLYCFITSLRICPCSCCRRQRSKESLSDVESSLSSTGSGVILLPPANGHVVKTYTTTKVIDIVKPTTSSLKVKIPMSARVFFRQLKNYAGQIAENRASWFSHKETKPSDSFEFHVRPPSNHTSVRSIFGTTRYVPEQKYIDMPNDYFKVTTIGPKPEFQAVVRVEDEVTPPDRPSAVMWRQWEIPQHNSWLNASGDKTAKTERSELSFMVEPVLANNFSLAKKEKVYYDQYGSYDTIGPLDEFPDSGKVFLSKRLVSRPVPLTTSSHLFSDLHRIEKTFPANHTYSEIDERAPNGRLYWKKNAPGDIIIHKKTDALSLSATDLRAFQLKEGHSQTYTVLHNFDEQPLVRPRLEEVHVFNRDSVDSLAPPVPPKSPELVDEWRQAMGMIPNSDNVEVTFKVTSDASRSQLSHSWPSIDNNISTPESSTKLGSIAEEIYAKPVSYDTEMTDVKRRHSVGFDEYSGHKTKTAKIKKSASLSHPPVHNDQLFGVHRLESATIKRSKKGPLKVKKKNASAHLYSDSVRKIVKKNAESFAGSGLQGTIVAYNPFSGVENQETDLKLNDGQRWYRFEKVYQIGDRHTADPQYTITFNPSRSGGPETQFEELNRNRSNIVQTGPSYSTSEERRVVSGVQVDRWMHLSPPPSPPINLPPDVSFPPNEHYPPPILPLPPVVPPLLVPPAPPLRPLSPPIIVSSYKADADPPIVSTPSNTSTSPLVTSIPVVTTSPMPSSSVGPLLPSVTTVSVAKQVTNSVALPATPQRAPSPVPSIVSVSSSSFPLPPPPIPPPPPPPPPPPAIQPISHQIRRRPPANRKRDFLLDNQQDDTGRKFPLRRALGSKITSSNGSNQVSATGSDFSATTVKTTAVPSPQPSTSTQLG